MKALVWKWNLAKFNKFHSFNYYEKYYFTWNAFRNSNSWNAKFL